MEAADDRMGVVAAFSLLSVVCARAARLGVEASEDGIKLRNYFRTHHIAWSDIAYFGREKMTGRTTTVPTVVLQNGRKWVLHGLDSVFSGFGASSPLWDTAIASLSEELTRRKSAQWD